MATAKKAAKKATAKKATPKKAAAKKASAKKSSAKKPAGKDDPCWDGFNMVGMKEKNGKEVPNCVPEEGTKKKKK